MLLRRIRQSPPPTTECKQLCQQVVDRVMKEKKAGPTTFETLGQVKNIVEGWCAFHNPCCDRTLAVHAHYPLALSCSNFMADDDCLYLVSC